MLEALEALGGQGGGGGRAWASPQEGWHKLGGMDVGQKGLGVDIKVPAEGHAQEQLLLLRLVIRVIAAAGLQQSWPGRRLSGCGAAAGLKVHLVPAIGR